MAAAPPPSFRRVLVVALTTALLVSLVPAAIAQATDPLPPDAPTQIVAGHQVIPAHLPAATAHPSARATANARVVTPREHPKPGSISEAALRFDRRSEARVSGAATTGPSRGQRHSMAVSGAFSATNTAIIPAGNGGAANATGATIASRFLLASSTQIRAFTATTGTAWEVGSFFAIPADEYYWGAFADASLDRGRFVTVSPSFDGPDGSCANGWLNVAVSSTSDPMQAWTRFRIALPDSWTDIVHIGVSDDKVVFTTNDWDLDGTQDDCLGVGFEGSHVRVVDWADLIDGGTLTVRDLTPAPATSFYGWIAADNVPGTASTAAGTTLHLLGEGFVDGAWGDIIHTTLTGSAKAATAALTAPVDLTVSAALRPLGGPPADIVAFPTGNGFQDESILSAVSNAGRLWFSTNDMCQVDPNPDYHACARYVALDTTVSPPTMVDHADFLDLDRDTFMPLVGVSRDGTAYFTMSASSAITQAPIDHYATFRDLGDGIIGGADEVLFRPGDAITPFDDFGQVGSVIADPLDGHAVYAIYPSLDKPYLSSGEMAGRVTRLNGDLTGAAGGTFTIDTGTESQGGWGPRPNVGLKFVPNADSPILWTRYSASPELEGSVNGQRLRFAVEVPSVIYGGADLSSTALGGTSGSSVTAYVQWRTADGDYSEPVSQTLQLDTALPSVALTSRRFLTGSVLTTAPIAITWSGSDAPSGIAKFYPIIGSGQTVVPSTTTSASGRLTIGVQSQVGVGAQDLAGNYQLSTTARTKILTKQGSAAGIKYTKTWRTASSSHYLGRSTRYSSIAGAKFSVTTTARAIAFVSTKAKSRGKAKIYVDGKYVALIDLKSTTTKYRQIVWQRSWASSGKHTVTVVVSGTRGRPRVDADAFLRF